MPDLGKFVHLHLHSQYSLLDGACRFGPLFDRVKELGMGAVALTDHGNLFGALGFYEAGRKSDVKPIIGCEVYVSPNGRADRKSVQARRNLHFVLLAETTEGYHNLARLTSLGFMEGFYYKPRIDTELLAEHSKGLIGLSACLSGVVADYLVEDDMPGAQRSIDDFVQILGPDNFYMELMDHGIDIQKKVNEGILELARKNGLPLVATNDCHYLTAEDYDMHDVLLCIQTGKTIEEKNRLRFHQNEFYMKTPDQMIGMFGHLNGAVENTIALADRCNAEIKTGLKLLPHFDPPKGKTQEGYLRELAEEGLAHRYKGQSSSRHRERMEFELGVIHSMGFDSYFLIVWDFIHYAKGRGVPVGPGRGSGAGSIVAYSLGITDIDPLEHGLLFERFLNPERVSMPDFDIDFCPERREEVIQYVRDKYGERNVAQIITFGTMKAKAAVRDVGRAMDIPISDVERVCKMIPTGPGIELKKTIEENQELGELAKSDPDIGALLKRALEVEGAVRHSSIHAAGVVIADQDLTRLIPLYMPPGTKDLVTQFTMKQVERLGLLKMDFLGLKNLTLIDKTIAEVKRTQGIEIDWDEIPLDDPDTYALLQSGDAFGLFQLESSGMRDLLTQLLPEKFSDIVALISLYRPGPMDNIPEFIARRHGRKEIEYDHEILEPILKETYGLIVYQEQVMQIAQALAGFSLGQADILRRAMGKKDKKEMASQETDFLAGAAEKDVDRDQALKIFALIKKFAEYGFNKSHSAAYTMVTFQTAYLKSHYPVEFMAQLLNTEIGGNDEKIALYASAAASMGVEILPPDINESRSRFAVHAPNIRYGLLAIKNVGAASVDSFIAEREENGPYLSVQDFIARQNPRLLNSRTIECMVKCGVFDWSGHNRPSIMKALPSLMQHVGADNQALNGAQTSLFDIMSPEALSDLKKDERIEAIDDWPEHQKLDIEKELTGHYLSGHPLRRFDLDVASFGSESSTVIKKKDAEERVTWLGLVCQMTIRTQKNDGRPFAMLQCEDMHGSLDATLFSKSYEKYREHIREGAVLWFTGTVNIWNDKVSIRVFRVETTDEVRRKRIRGLVIRIPSGQVTEASITQLRDVLAAHHGRRPVHVVITENGSALAIQAGGKLSVSPGDELVEALQNASFEKKLTYLAD